MPESPKSNVQPSDGDKIITNVATSSSASNLSGMRIVEEQPPPPDKPQVQLPSENADLPGPGSATSHAAPDIPLDPQGIPYFFPRVKKVLYDKKKRLIDVDQKAYYDGKILEAIERAILHYHCHLYRIWAFPESLENKPELFEKEMRVLFLCVKKGFKDLGLTSVQDIIYRLTYRNGIALLVSLSRSHFKKLLMFVLKVFESRAGARGAVKVFAHKAIMNHNGFHAPQKKEELESVTFMENHRKEQQARARLFWTGDAFVKTTGENAVRYQYFSFV